MRPSRRYELIQSVHPAASASKKRAYGNLLTPARQAEAIPNPGTNFANKNAPAPRLPKAVSVFLTQVSGSRASLHNNFRTERPFRRPSSYQTVSPRTAAITAASSDETK